MKNESQDLKKPLVTYGDPLDSILKDLCDAVEADYYSIDFTEKDWYYQHSWTMQDQIDFKNQLIKKIKNNKKFYSSIVDTSSDRAINKNLEMFLFTYGWKFKKEN